MHKEHYLDELMDVTTHNLIRRHTREDPELLCSKGILCPRQGKASIIPNAGQARVGLFLPFIYHALLLWAWGDLFH